MTVNSVDIFAAADEVADCAAVIVAYNSAADVAGLLDTLPQAAAGLRVRPIVVDNDSRDDIEGVASRYPGVVFVAAGGNLGYAGGINLGRRHAGPTRSIMVLNPDLRLSPGSVSRLFEVLGQPGVGAVVPRILDEAGGVFRSLRREPTIGRALGDALLGKHWPGRPAWLSETVWVHEPYDQPGTVDWATGAALLISAETDAAVGAWDDIRFFLYSEETDYCRRLRQAGWAVRYVPDAVVTHRGGGSGSGTALAALNEVNRLRYYRKYHGRLASLAFGTAVALNELLRIHRPANRRALRAVLSPLARSALPASGQPSAPG